jgi:ankyrin repeat protein
VILSMTLPQLAGVVLLLNHVIAEEPMRLGAAFLMAFLGLAPLSALAQVPPSEGEIAAYSGLFAAAHVGDVAAIRTLASRENVNARDGHGRTPLHVATHARKIEAMEALVAAGADPRAKDSRNYDAITIAAVADSAETMSAAIRLGGTAKEITSPYLGTALIAAAHLGHDEVVRRLIKAGAPLDHVNNLGWTALIEAVILGDGGPRHVACAKALVEAGARRDLADREGRTPLDHARNRGYQAMIAVLEK